jgi:hypothetical protein
MQFLPPAINYFSVPRSAPLRGNGARAVPIIVARSGAERGTMGTPLEQCNFFPQLSIISPFLVPLRSVGTGQGLYQSLSLGAERNEERRENGCNGQNRITTTQTQRVHPQNRNAKKLKV